MCTFTEAGRGGDCQLLARATDEEECAALASHRFSGRLNDGSNATSQVILHRNGLICTKQHLKLQVVQGSAVLSSGGRVVLHGLASPHLVAALD